MGYQKKTTQRKFSSKSKPQEKRESSGIVPTDSWIYLKGKAVYVNIAESDIDVKDGRVSFITSASNLQRLVEGEIGGINLGKFAE
jgi:hypothetical protein